MNYDENMSLFQKETKDEADRIEEEIQGNEPISVPFDPNLIRIRRDPFTLGELIDKIEYNEVNLIPLFNVRAIYGMEPNKVD